MAVSTTSPPSTSAQCFLCTSTAVRDKKRRFCEVAWSCLGALAENAIQYCMFEWRSTVGRNDERLSAMRSSWRVCMTHQLGPPSALMLERVAEVLVGNAVTRWSVVTNKKTGRLGVPVRTGARNHNQTRCAAGCKIHMLNDATCFRYGYELSSELFASA